jgi:hypothetical protein
MCKNFGMDDTISNIKKIIKNIDDNFIENKPRMMRYFQKDIQSIEIDLVFLKSLKYNLQNKYFFDFNDDLKYVKAYIIRWDKYVDIHDHPVSGCIFKLLHGKLRSTLYTKTKQYKDTIYYHNNMVDYIDDEIGYHDIENVNYGDYSYSIHIYEKNYIPKFFSK